MKATELIALASICWCTGGQMCDPVMYGPCWRSSEFHRHRVCVCVHPIEAVLFLLASRRQQSTRQPHFQTDCDYQNTFIKPFTCITERTGNISVSLLQLLHRHHPSSTPATCNTSHFSPLTMGDHIAPSWIALILLSRSLTTHRERGGPRPALPGVMAKIMDLPGSSF